MTGLAYLKQPAVRRLFDADSLNAETVAFIVY